MLGMRAKASMTNSQRHTQLPVINKLKQQLVAPSRTAELKLLKKAIWITLSHPFSILFLWQALYVPVKPHFPIYCQRLPFHITHQSVRNVTVMKTDTVVKRRWATAIVGKVRSRSFSAEQCIIPAFPQLCLPKNQTLQEYASWIAAIGHKLGFKMNSMAR